MRLSGRVSWGLPPVTAGSPATTLPGPVNGSVPVCWSPLVKGMRVRQNGHRASNWTPWPGRSRGRDVRQAGRGMPRAVSGRLLRSRCLLGGGAGAALRAGVEGGEGVLDMAADPGAVGGELADQAPEEQRANQGIG